jgi:Mrp family chromosome partitioning ATPase
VLLIDVQQPIGWADSDILTLSDMLASGNIVHKEQAMDMVTVRPSPKSRYAFADTAQFRMILEPLLESYHYVILQLAPVLTPHAAALNPLPIGAACDYLLLACRRGATGQSELRVGMDKLRAARCPVGGIILNEATYSSPGAEIACFVSWIFWPLPWLRRRVQKWAMNTELLN